MRTELKIGLTVLLVVSVMALVYFVFFAGEQQKPRPKEELGSITRSPDPNPAPAPRVGRGGRASRGTSRGPEANTVLASGVPRAPAPPPAVAPAPRPADPTPIIIPPTPFVSSVSSRPAGEPTVDAEPRVHADGIGSDMTIASRSEAPPSPTIIPPVVLPPPPAPAPRAAEPNRAAPPAFVPTPLVGHEPPRTPTIAPPVIDDRAAVTPVLPGAVEGNAALGPRTGLIRKPDGKDYYVVQPGDKGYIGIAEKPFVYGDGNKWDLIAKANPSADSARLKPGQELVIPPVPRAAASRPAADSNSHPAGVHGTYVIKAGDTLESIAKSQYGDGSLWKDIAKANPDVDPTRLKIGKELVIPPLPAGRTPTVTPIVVPPATPVLGPTSRPTVRPAVPRPTPTSSPAPVRPSVPAGFD